MGVVHRAGISIFSHSIYPRLGGAGTSFRNGGNRSAGVSSCTVAGGRPGTGRCRRWPKHPDTMHGRPAPATTPTWGGGAARSRRAFSTGSARRRPRLAGSRLRDRRAVGRDPVARHAPKSLISIDPSEGFVATARANVPDARAAFQVGDAQALTQETDSRDVIVSGAGPQLRSRQAKGARRDEARRPPRRNGRRSTSGTIPAAASSSCAPSGPRRRRSIPPRATSPRTGAFRSARRTD